MAIKRIATATTDCISHAAGKSAEEVGDVANVYNDPTAWIAIGRINKAERQKQEQERQSKRGKTFERYYEKEIKAHGKR